MCSVLANVTPYRKYYGQLDIALKIIGIPGVRKTVVNATCSDVHVGQCTFKCVDNSDKYAEAKKNVQWLVISCFKNILFIHSVSVSRIQSVDFLIGCYWLL